MAFLGLPRTPGVFRAAARPSIRSFRSKVAKNLRASIPASLVLLLGGMAMQPAARAEEAPAPSEYEVKAVFLYHFTKFVEWPPETFLTSNAPVRIGILGRNPFNPYLERCVKDKLANGRPIVVQPISSISDPALKQCQILFIQPADRTRFGETIDSLKRAPILTVSEAEGFLQAGGMINFVMEGKRVRFIINGAAANQAGLKISSKLLNLARKPEAGR